MKPAPRITLTEQEQNFLLRFCLGEYNPMTASIEDQDMEIALIDKAALYEAENGLIDERIDFTPNCSLLKWYYYRYLQQDKDTNNKSNNEIIVERLQKGETVYMKDDFYDVAIRLVGSWDNYLKHKGRFEVQVPHGYDLVSQIELGGEFITKEEYENY